MRCRQVDLDIRPGEKIGLIGPSGAGKTALARALTGLWPAAVGTVRLGGATTDQFGAAALNPGAVLGLRWQLWRMERQA